MPFRPLGASLIWESEKFPGKRKNAHIILPDNMFANNI
jgi:hypothetical protein